MEDSSCAFCRSCAHALSHAVAGAVRRRAARLHEHAPLLPRQLAREVAWVGLVLRSAAGDKLDGAASGAGYRSMGVALRAAWLAVHTRSTDDFPQRYQPHIGVPTCEPRPVGRTASARVGEALASRLMVLGISSSCAVSRRICAPKA
jgi:hypothetical protein